ncbi:hypothetical protein [Prochlorothrix hollandica]|uniref:hypothetical protein n=1 Tax=Prochlorothrix hollandica TaxID=1223 RepID=UPI00034A187C|nr:hypothetical protein [Prochlorothrix hollandica]
MLRPYDAPPNSGTETGDLCPRRHSPAAISPLRPSNRHNSRQTRSSHGREPVTIGSSGE